MPNTPEENAREMMADADKNLCGKTRKVNDPYEIYIALDWEWRVLKKYQKPSLEKTNPYARWFCAVKGPGTYDGYDMGDTYINDIIYYGEKLNDDQIKSWCRDNPWKEY